MAADLPPALTVSYREKVRPFIDLVDGLRASGLDRDVTLPSVVVIGDQSTGKSSCLEAISGVQLPRGTGVVTRCPLELRLKKSQNPESPWAGCIRYHPEGQDGETVDKIDSPEDVGEAVRKAQDSLAGRFHGISARLITLDVESPDIPDVTLIDLPGIARIAVGQQPKDIGAQTKALIKKYIQKDETIILVVVPCNQDIATVEALKLAQEADPTGARTLGVLTKPDLIDPGTEATILDIMDNRKYPLKKGYTIIKCRGQKDIDEDVPLSEATDNEEKFFKFHDYFEELFREKKTGTRTLASKLTTELVEQIKKSVPLLKKDINEKLAQTDRELRLMGTGVPQDPMDRMRFLVDLLNEFTGDLEKLANGDNSRTNMTRKEQDELKLISKVREAHEQFETEIQGLLPDKDMLDDIKVIIETNRGIELPGFLSYPVCQALIREQVDKFKEPANDCLQRVNQEVESVASQLTTDRFQAFPPLEMEIKRRIDDLRQAQEKTAREVIEQQFEMESLVFTQDKIFKKAFEEVEKEDTHAKRKKDGFQFVDERSDQEKEAERMLQNLKAYINVSVTRLADTVPMAISLHLLTKFAQEVKTQMSMMIGQAGKTLELLQEDEDIVDKRRALEEKRDRLHKAYQKLVKFN